MENKHQKKGNVVSFVPNGDYYYEKALKAIEKDKMDQAYKYLKRAAELSPDDAQVLSQYGLLEIEAQNYEKAYELIHTAHSLDPNDAQIIFLLADVSGCIGLIHDAKKYAEKYLELEPDGMYALDAYEILDFVEYEEEMNENLDEQDSEKIVGQEKARRYMEQGDFDKAIEVLEKLIEQFPDAWPAYNNLSLAYFYVGEAEQARALLNHVLRENHGNLHALCNLTVIAYYEKNEEDLQELLNILKKIQPYEWDNRYKLGATLALVGEYEIAYKWLRSMSKRGYEGDPGFYFWLSQAAYFSGHEEIARTAWTSLVQIDPTKEGYEPWLQGDYSLQNASLENNRELIIEKINNNHTADRLFGFFLLNLSAHKQEIIAHPKWIDISKYNDLEKLCLAYALGHQFNLNIDVEKHFVRLMDVAELIVKQNGSIQLETASILQLWFALSEIALKDAYTFKNTAAIAAAVDYMFHSSMDHKVTKKEVAQKYSTTVSTMTKYMSELLQFIPTELV